MDIYDKLIIVCIIFTILAILSIVFGCHYLTKKTEGFAVNSIEEILLKIKEMVTDENIDDFTIVEYMKKHSELFKNEKFVDKVVKTLENLENAESKENSKKSKKKSKK